MSRAPNICTLYNINTSMIAAHSSWSSQLQRALSANMKATAIAAAVLSFASTALCADKSNLTKPLTSRLILPSTFSPPQVFRNINLVHVINLEKGYPKESINVVIENTADVAQNEYFIPFTNEQMERIGGLEVKDRKDAELGLFDVEATELDMERYEQLCLSRCICLT